MEKTKQKNKQSLSFTRRSSEHPSVSEDYGIPALDGSSVWCAKINDITNSFIYNLHADSNILKMAIITYLFTKISSSSRHQYPKDVGRQSYSKSNEGKVSPTEISSHKKTQSIATQVSVFATVHTHKNQSKTKHSPARQNATRPS